MAKRNMCMRIPSDRMSRPCHEKMACADTKTPSSRTSEQRERLIRDPYAAADVAKAGSLPTCLQPMPPAAMGPGSEAGTTQASFPAVDLPAHQRNRLLIDLG